MTTRRMGRPTLDPTDRSITFTITLPRRQFDQYAVAALREKVSVPEIVRRELGCSTKQLKSRQPE